MADRSDAEAVLVTGAFGTGKTSTIEEIADILEARGVRYGAIDLDWLSWFDPGSGGDHWAGMPGDAEERRRRRGQLLRHGRPPVRAGAHDGDPA